MLTAFIFIKTVITKTHLSIYIKTSEHVPNGKGKSSPGSPYMSAAFIK